MVFIFIDGTADELSKDDFFKEINNIPNDLDIIFFATRFSCLL